MERLSDGAQLLLLALRGAGPSGNAQRVGGEAALQYAAGMSAKQQLAELVAALPEDVSLQEAFELLYQALQDKLGPEGRRRLGVLAGRVKMTEDLDAERSAPASVGPQSTICR